MSKKNLKWVYVQRPEGEVNEQSYQLVEEDIPEPKENEILVRAIYISVDPYMRIQQSKNNTWEQPHQINTVQGAGVVGIVVESKDKTGSIKEGDYVNVYGGWQLYVVWKAEEARKLDPSIAPISTALGLLGMPGRTAYFGLLDAGKPKEGETVVVSGAAGAVGSIVVQIAKIKGCRVVVIAGSPEKLEFLKKEYGADETLDYTKYNKDYKLFKEALEKVCPNGIDVYFDNVGGFVTDAVFQLINLRARVVICGQISQYNHGLDSPDLGPRFLHHILYKRATIQGILARDFVHRMPEMLEEMSKWLNQGKLKFHETFEFGFEKLPKTLNGLFHGRNVGKMLVCCDEEYHQKNHHA